MYRIAKPACAVVLLAMFLGACGGASPAPTPTLDLNVAATSVAQTVIAGFTQTALALPTATDTPGPTDTSQPTATIEIPTVGPGTEQPGQTPPANSGTPGAFPSLTPLPSPFASPIGGYCDEMTYIKDVTIPDGTTVYRNQGFTKTWLVKNTGSCKWSAGYRLIVAGGNWMGYLPLHLPDFIKHKTSVDVGEQVNITIELGAPSTPGTYETFFQLVNDTGGLPFGSLLVSIKVVKEPVPTKKK